MDPRMYKRRFALFPLFGLIAAFAIGAVVMLLWNAILPSVLHAERIGYWQALGLLVLCRILFGGFGGRKGPGRWGDWRQHGGEPGRKFGAWRSKWMEMSPEERIKFKQEMRRRCGKPPENM